MPVLRKGIPDRRAYCRVRAMNALEVLTDDIQLIDFRAGAFFGGGEHRAVLRLDFDEVRNNLAEMIFFFRQVSARATPFVARRVRKAGDARWQCGETLLAIGDERPVAVANAVALEFGEAAPILAGCVQFALGGHGRAGVHAAASAGRGSGADEPCLVNMVAQASRSTVRWRMDSPMPVEFFLRLLSQMRRSR
jgi:hypothetical protein